MIKKVLLIDDESDARELLKQYLAQQKGFRIIGECSNGIEAVQQIDTLQPDIIFIDIQMPGLTGMQVVQKIRHNPAVVFTTAYDEYALNAFNADAVDYLLKPYTEERFLKALGKVSGGLPSEPAPGSYPTRILVEFGNRFINLAVRDIEYIEADKDYCRIYAGRRTYLSNTGIGLLEQKLDSSVFLRIHRSYIINLEHLRELHKEAGGAQAIMANGQSLTVSRGYIDSIRRLII